jgi:hypothetical protein
MSIRPISHKQRTTLAAIAGGLAGGVVATVIGTPLIVLCLLAGATVAYSCGWRIMIVKKRPEDDPIDI